MAARISARQAKEPRININVYQQRQTIFQSDSKIRILEDFYDIILIRIIFRNVKIFDMSGIRTTDLRILKRTPYH